MSIPLIDGFKINRSVPIDDRTVVETYGNLSSIDYLYIGLPVYVKNEDSTYIWNGSTWRISESGGGTAYVLHPATTTVLGGIKVGANLTIDINGNLSAPAAYTHPSQHLPSIIAQDSNNRFVTDAQISLWTGKENSLGTGTISQYLRGDKTWQTLNKTAVGLSNVDNTSDLDKPISNATQAAINAIDKPLKNISSLFVLPPAP